jgi:hypothetical protein
MNLTMKKNSSGENHPVLQQPAKWSFESRNSLA